MFLKNCRKFVWLIVFTLCLTSIATPYKNSANSLHLPPPDVSTNSLSEENGLKTAVFKLKEGTIIVRLPDDVSAGDSISGTVSAGAFGFDKAQEQKNADRLKTFTLGIEDQKKPLTEGIVKFKIPEKLKKNVFDLVVRDSKGKRISRIKIPANPGPVESPTAYQIPEMGQTGRTVNIAGEFDGDLSNTSCEIGEKKAKPLAESPRKTVFESPPDIIGPTNLKISEGNTEITQNFRNVNVSLGAGKLNLLKGESTNLTIKVEGFQGIEEEVPLNLVCTGSANMQGGNVQNLQISPNQVVENGNFTQTRNLTGFRTGNFNVTATVLLNAGPLIVPKQIVHVEKAPANIGGENLPKLWFVRVKTLDGKIVDIYIKQEKEPNLKVCDWIQINELTDGLFEDWIYVSSFQKTEDPKKPCELNEQFVQIVSNPVKLSEGVWFVSVKLQNGQSRILHIRSPNKPDFGNYKWLRIWDCNKLNSNTFVVNSYTPTISPNVETKNPVLTEIPPTPTPTPVPTPPVSTLKPCLEGTKRKEKIIVKTFEILEKDSKLAFSIKTNNGDGGATAAGMAAWLKGISSIGGTLTKYIPEEAAVGSGVADAALQYVDLGGDILGALARSNLRNLNVNKVTGKLDGEVTKVRAVCTSYEVCINGRWIRKEEYSETKEKTSYSTTITVEPKDNGWDKVTVTSKPQFFDPDKADKYLMKELLNELKKNETEYKKFKDDCK